MKKVYLFIIMLFSLVSCTSVESVKIYIENSDSTDHTNEIVTIPYQIVATKLKLTNNESFIVLDDQGAQIHYQVIYDGETEPQSIIFPATVATGKKIIYDIKKGEPELFQAKTFGRSVPERKDDFAWENDRIAFRMYGPALASENPSNGVDIWLKKTNELVLNKFYSDELEKGLSYHVDHGQGLDCYKVAHTLGAGGIAPFVNDSLWIGGYYSTAKVLDNGPLRTSFVLTYDSIVVNGKILKEKIRITLDALSQLNKATVSYEGDFDNFQVAAGMWLHKEIGNMKINKDGGYIAYGEHAVSDAGLEAGRNYIGVIFPDKMVEARQHDAHLLGFANYKKGEQFTYYFGAGWSEWGFNTDDDWFAYIDRYASNLKNPLKVTIE